MSAVTELSGDLVLQRSRSDDLIARIAALKSYARSCLSIGDWHGLRDAAADLEIIEARLDEQARK